MPLIRRLFPSLFTLSIQVYFGTYVVFSRNTTKFFDSLKRIKELDALLQFPCAFFFLISKECGGVAF